MHALYLGWIDLLEERPGKIPDRLLESRDPSFSAVSVYAAELALGLWFKGLEDEARRCLDRALSLDCEGRNSPTRFRALRLIFDQALHGTADEPLREDAMESQDWVAVVGYAIAAEDYGQEIWSVASILDPISTKAFARKLKIYARLQWENEY